MVVDKPDWSQESYQESSIDEERLELGRIIKEQQARIAELETQNSELRAIDAMQRIADLEAIIADYKRSGESADKVMYEQRLRIAELEAENAELKARWADMCAGMWKVELWEKGK